MTTKIIKVKCLCNESKAEKHVCKPLHQREIKAESFTKHSKFCMECGELLK